MAHETRYYQTEAELAVFNALKRSVKNQLLVMATGSGKTRCGVNIVKNFSKILWITHNIELIEQSSIALISEELDYSKEYVEYNLNIRGGIQQLLRSKIVNNEFSKQIKDSIGIIKEDLMITDKRFTVASIQTLCKRLDQLDPELFDVIIVDEAHHAGATTWTNTLNHFNPVLRLGLTATPWRAEDDMSLDELFEEIVYEYPIEKGIRDGFLSKPDAVKVKTSANLDKVHTVGSDFNQKELSEKVNTPERNYLIVNKYLEYAKGRPFIAFCCNVQHTIDLCEAFNEKGVKARFVVGDKKITLDRKKEIKEFKNQKFVDGEYEGLINCMIATEGFDFENIGCVINAAPTKSKTKFYQMIGRGLRLKSFEFVKMFAQNCIILDIVDNTTRHRLINCESEDMLRELDDKIFISEINRQKLRDAKMKREMMVTIVDRDKDEIIELFPLPKVKTIGSSRLIERAPDKMIERVKRLGFDTEHILYTKLMCAEILSNLPANEADIEKIKGLGYNVSNGVTIAEASLILKK